jgi:hypothetical protein
MSLNFECLRPNSGANRELVAARIQGDARSETTNFGPGENLSKNQATAESVAGE